MSARSGNSVGGYLLRRMPIDATGKIFFQSYVVSAEDKSNLEVAANEDSYKYAYNGVISFLAGLSGLYAGQAAWTVTKMYYSAFYIARASLCRNHHVIFHVPKNGSLSYTQYELKVAAGERASVSSIPSTHKLVASRFQKGGVPRFMQGLLIDGLDPVNWLMEQREHWQYRSGRFPDPEPPSILSQLDLQKLQRFLAAYAEDERGLYLSDPDHALIAIPFRLITWYLSLAPLAGTNLFTPEDLRYLQKSCSPGGQKITAISRLLDG